MQTTPDPRSTLAEQLATELLEEADYGPSDKRWSARIARVLRVRYDAEVAVIRREFFADRRGGMRAAKALAELSDLILSAAYDFVTTHLFPNGNPTDGERLSIVATGGYGRGELAPFSDLDIMFLTAMKLQAWQEQVIETMLYVLWDMGFKLGHAVRSVDEALKLAGGDLTIKTALLEARHICGDAGVTGDFISRYRKTVAGKDPAFIEEKLAERDTRHARFGGTSLVVEPNIKDGKGGLRDLQTLWWILQFLYDQPRRETIATEGLLSQREYHLLLQAENFLWTVRFALHFEAGRGEDRLTFSYQQKLAERLRYRTGEGNKQVERFMKHVFTVAKQVGDLTRIFCAVLEERHQKKSLMERFQFRRRIRGFRATGQTLQSLVADEFRETPARMLEIFRAMAESGFDIHPVTLRSIKASLSSIDDTVRQDPAANAHFMAVLTDPTGSDVTLRRMNEAGVFGRFVPDFGRVVAQMQFDMYHHYTVDEHTIQAVSLVSKIDAGLLAEDHPICTAMIQKLVSKRVLYVAVLLHDIAKGRPRDHSIVGAEIAYELCPRLGLTEAETETVAWLVRWHLFMAMTAFKRDLADPKTVEDFCIHVKSPERLRLLLILTIVDIRAVGPGVYNAWKGRLLSELFHLAEERLVAGHAILGRAERVAAKKAWLQGQVGQRQMISTQTCLTMNDRWPDSYWIAEDDDMVAANATLIDRVEASQDTDGTQISALKGEGVARLSVYASDRLGLFARVVGAIATSGAVIREAKIHSSADGAALENFILQGTGGRALTAKGDLNRIEAAILEAVRGQMPKRERVTAPRGLDTRLDAFEVVPVVLIDNKASNRSSVIEVNGKDRPGLLFDLAQALVKLKLNILSAHVQTFGERVVDVFYVTERDGGKPTHPRRLKNIEAKLLAAVIGPDGAATRPEKAA